MLGTKVQYNKRHLMTLAFLTLTKGQDHTTRSKVTDMEVFAFSECFLLSFFFSFSFSLIMKKKIANLIKYKPVINAGMRNTSAIIGSNDNNTCAS